MDEKDFVSMALHNEFARRMEEEHTRQNHRIREMGEMLSQNNKLLVSVEKLALNMENMQKELKKQNDRLAVLESRDGEMWRKVVGYAITGVIGIVIGFLFKQIGM